MTAPTPPEGKFVTSDEAVARFEGTFPSGRVLWLKWRIFDAENELMGKVKSLRKTIPEITADSEAVGDPGRLDRVKSLIIEKVLDLHRNPNRSTSVTSEMDGFRETVGFAQNRTPTRTGVSFTEDELSGIRLPKGRRPKIGTYGVRPWGIPC